MEKNTAWKKMENLLGNVNIWDSEKFIGCKGVRAPIF